MNFRFVFSIIPSSLSIVLAGVYCALWSLVGVQVDDWLRFAFIEAEPHPLCVLSRLRGTLLPSPSVLIG